MQRARAWFRSRKLRGMMHEAVYRRYQRLLPRGSRVAGALDIAGVNNPDVVVDCTVRDQGPSPGTFAREHNLRLAGPDLQAKDASGQFGDLPRQTHLGLLEADLRRKLAALPAESDTVSSEISAAMVSEFNRLLGQRDLYE